MGLSYTGETTMNEGAFRDVDVDDSSGRNFGHNGQWRDKIEVRLDNRQVFFLFFGSALCACMLFVLGVIVGKRLESRGRAAIPEVQDPLAVLDRINSSAGPGAASGNGKSEPALTFPKALIGAPAKARVGPAPSSRPLAPPTASPSTATAVKVPSAPRPLAPAIAIKTPAPQAAPRLPSVASIKLAPSIAPKATPVAAVTVAVAPAAPVAAATAAAKGKYSLVLSSFPERGEADAFAKRFAAQGAYVAVAETPPGKGNVYRVRVGNYGSLQEAAAAKTSFEKLTNTIAYVAGR